MIIEGKSDALSIHWKGSLNEGGCPMDYSTRYDQRKKKRVNRLLNLAIVIVICVILFIVVQLLFGSSNTEDALADLDEEVTIGEEEQANGEQDHLLPAEDNEEPSVEDESNNRNREISDEKDESEQDRVAEGNENLLEDEPNERLPGAWQPIGTSQTEPFEADFSKDSLNWKEMTHALQYATGLGDEIIIWRLENGGNLQSAVGTVSDYQTRDTPYQVRLEWIPNRGWQPIEVIVLEENPYRY